LSNFLVAKKTEFSGWYIPLVLYEFRTEARSYPSCIGNGMRTDEVRNFFKIEKFMLIITYLLISPSLGKTIEYLVDKI